MAPSLPQCKLSYVPVLFYGSASAPLQGQNTTLWPMITDTSEVAIFYLFRKTNQTMFIYMFQLCFAYMGALKKQLFVYYEDNNDITLWRHLVVDFQESKGYVQYSRVYLISVNFMNIKIRRPHKIAQICRGLWVKMLNMCIKPKVMAFSALPQLLSIKMCQWTDR